MISSFDLFPIGVDGVTSNSISFHIRMYMEAYSMSSNMISVYK